MRSLRIAIIDDGICTTEVTTMVSAYKVISGKVVEDLKGNYSSSSHGTICAKIIEKYCPKQIELISIRILNDCGLGNINDLLCALNWCNKNSIDIVNLSNGVTQCSELQELYNICAKLNYSGIKIVAAQNNSKVCTYPADFPFVISVEQRRYTSYYSLMRSNVYTKGNHKILVDDRMIKTERCNSFACAYTTAQIAQRLLSNKDCKSPFVRREYRLSDNAIQWLDKIIFKDDFFAKVEQCSDFKYEKYDVVIDGSCNIKTIEHYWNRIRSVIFLGKMPYRLKLKCKHKKILYWDESSFQAKHAPKISSTPTILIELPHKQNKVNVVKELEESFRTQKYVSATLSDIRGSCLEGFIYSQTTELSSMVEYVERYWVPDVLFITTHNSTCEIEYDIKIQILAEGYQVSYETTSVFVKTFNELLTMLHSVLTA